MAISIRVDEDVLASTYFALALPAGTPRPIAQRLHQEMKRALSAREVDVPERFALQIPAPEARGAEPRDDTLAIGVTTIKAQHIIELRQACDAMRAVAGLAPAPWMDLTISPTSTIIKTVHIQELRTYLNDAASRLGYSTSSYTVPTLSTGFVIMRVHIEELRQRIRNIAG